ncbi:lipid II flippase MurJ [Streptomyces sp. NPDC002055]|uniref:lipid II flippase MurJ n=1 Tax=Streptomyces sp. NPDC002055 TaxID=3154534 RepID=UPI00332D7A90
MSDAVTVPQHTAGTPAGTGAPAGDPAPRPGERFVARAAAVTAVLTAAGALFGLVRDQLIAHLFGASGETDAFLVAWTVPEIAATLLIEDAMALVMIPAFSLALSRRAAGSADAVPDPVGGLVAATAPRLFLTLAGAAAALAAAAPWLVRLLAPGLADPGTAVDCTRFTAVTVLCFGIAGYFSAALRAHRRFVPPAAIYVAYNAGIIATVLALHRTGGVRAAAAGVALGGVLMVLVQLPSILRQFPARTGRRLRRAPERRGDRSPVPAAVPGALARVRTVVLPGLRRPAGPLAAPAGPSGGAPPPSGGPQGTPRVRTPRARTVPLCGPVLAPVALFALTRQAQVLVERHLASSLPAGAISHLNYAQKVAQVPMVLSLMVCTVTFPLVARAMADGQADRARRRVERDLTLAGLVVLLGAAYVAACAPQLIQLLFQRGAFDSHDTAATASVMRVYALGLLGHSLTGALIRPYFSAARPTWHPAASMAAGLLITIVGARAAVPYCGVLGIAAANALGILVTALLLLRGLGRQGIAVDVRRVTAGLGRLALAAAVATAAGWAAASACGTAPVAAAAGCLVVLTAFAVTALCLRAPEIRLLLSSVDRRRRHAR